jgi:oligopeptide/dipeptide ABC transporter ATP-binding protein
VRQRVMIAMALACNPPLVIADEPTTALDVMIQAQILNLLAQLREERNIALLVITHDLALAWAIADRVAIMYLGKIVEVGPVHKVLTDPLHPYTKSLLAVTPEVGRRRTHEVLSGEPPDLAHIPPGCRFHPRCPVLRSGEAGAAELRCLEDVPALEELATDHRVACHVVAGSEGR